MYYQSGRSWLVWRMRCGLPLITTPARPLFPCRPTILHPDFLLGLCDSLRVPVLCPVSCLRSIAAFNSLGVFRGPLGSLFYGVVTTLLLRTPFLFIQAELVTGNGRDTERTVHAVLDVAAWRAECTRNVSST